MNLPEYIDLHMHSTISDGTDTPEEILALIQKEGLDLFSITDHDSIDGCIDILNILSKDEDAANGAADRPRFLTGVEFSCKDEEGKYHILGYGYDPASPSIRDVVEQGNEIRLRKVHARLDFLKEAFGFTFSEEDLAELFAQKSPGKPHIANMMVRYGYAESRPQAVHQYIDKLHMENMHVLPEPAIRGILGAGGVPILAHPSYGSGDQIVVGRQMDDRIKRLLDYGLQGIEVFYSGFTDKLMSELLALAEKYDLMVTAGSDYHGTNKMVRLGETNLPSVQEGPKGLRIFLERMEGHFH